MVHFSYGEIMDRFYSIVFIVLFVSATIRHIVRTATFIVDYREKVKNNRLERFKI